MEIRITGHNFGRGPSKDHSTKDWLQLAQWFLRRRFLYEFPIGSYVKLSLAVGAILVEGPNRRTHFWKGTTQESFQQSLVEIGSVVLEEKIFLTFHPPFFLICKIGKSSKFIKNPVIYVKKLIIMLIQFKFGHIFSNGSHLGYRTALTDTILKGDH